MQLALPPAPERKLLPAPYEHNVVCASHLNIGLQPEYREAKIPHILRLLRMYQFDSIAIQGLSGLLLGPIIARELGKTLIIVRKDNEDCHSGRTVEGDYNARRYVILDDFISSGATVRRMLREIGTDIPNAKCIGYCGYLWIDGETTALTDVSDAYDSPVKPKKFTPVNTEERLGAFIPYKFSFQAMFDEIVSLDIEGRDEP